MAHPIYHVFAGDILPIYFATYAGATGASITMSGLAVTDIEIFKDASMTQRASDAGYTLIDTDGIDIDGITGIHGFTIDTGDNTDAGFYTTGAWFTVVVSAITVDTQTVNFIAAQFRIVPAESSAGVPKVDVSHYGGTAGTFSSGRPEVNTTHVAGTAWASVDLTTTMKASVNAEVLDVMNVDTFAEIGQETPAATQTIRKMLAYLYKAWRNRTKVDGTTIKLYNDDATTVAQKATHSDTAGEYDKGEYTTGP